MSVGLAVNLVAIPALYPVVGYDAAAWGLTLGMICRFIFLTSVFVGVTRMHWLSIWLPRHGDLILARQAFRTVLDNGNRA